MRTWNNMAPRLIAEGGGSDLVDDSYPRNRQQRLLIIGGGLGAVQVLDSLCRIEHQRATAIVDDTPGTESARPFWACQF